MKKLLSALVAVAFVAVSAPAFAAEEVVNKAAQPGADMPSGEKQQQQEKQAKSSKKKSKKKSAPKTEDKAAAAPAK